MRLRFRRRALISALIGLPLALLFVAWRAASWRPVVRRVSTKPVLALHWESNGRTLFCVTGDGRWRVLSASLGILKTQGKSASWQQAQFSDNGLLLAASSDEVRLLNCKSGRTLWLLSYAKENAASNLWTEDVLAVALSPRGDALAFGTAWGNHGSSTLLRVRNARVVPDKGESGGVFWGEGTQAVTLSNNGALFWDATGDGSGFGIRRVNGGKTRWLQLPVPRVQVQGEAIACAFSPDNQVVATCFSGGGTMLWNAQNGRFLRLVPSGSLKQKVRPTFSPDSQTLVTGGVSGQCSQWNVHTGRLIKTFTSGAVDVSALSFSPDCSRLAVGTSTGEVQIWSLK